MAVGYNAREDEEAAVPKSSPSSTIHGSSNNNQPEPLHGATASTGLLVNEQNDVQLVIATLQARHLMRRIISNLLAHALLYGGSANPDHLRPCPDCVLLVLLCDYYI
ncbi:uncharacterized protein LOC121594442 [Anopheles merus]|uniref:Uncharacterized protein n=1 Tax=Anopheles merus TaxID=30066 RepID=A0A182V4T9_ANOME|nr:uncharacterized protein LOC121594442 [Anopheles merus]